MPGREHGLADARLASFMNGTAAGTEPQRGHGLPNARLASFMNGTAAGAEPWAGGGVFGGVRGRMPSPQAHRDVLVAGAEGPSPGPRLRQPPKPNVHE